MLVDLTVHDCFLDQLLLPLLLASPSQLFLDPLSQTPRTQAHGFNALFPGVPDTSGGSWEGAGGVSGLTSGFLPALGRHRQLKDKKVELETPSWVGIEAQGLVKLHVMLRFSQFLALWSPKHCWSGPDGSQHQ